MQAKAGAPRHGIDEARERRLAEDAEIAAFDIMRLWQVDIGIDQAGELYGAVAGAIDDGARGDL